MVNLIKISNPDLLSIQITASFVSWRQYSNIRCYFCLQILILHAHMQFGKFLSALYLYDSVTIWVCYAKIVDRTGFWHIVHDPKACIKHVQHIHNLARKMQNYVTPEQYKTCHPPICNDQHYNAKKRISGSFLSLWILLKCIRLQLLFGTD